MFSFKEMSTSENYFDIDQRPKFELNLQSPLSLCMEMSKLQTVNYLPCAVLLYLLQS